MSSPFLRIFDYLPPATTRDHRGIHRSFSQTKHSNKFKPSLENLEDRTLPTVLITQIDVARNQNGRLEVFALADPTNTKNVFFSNTQTTPGGAWGGWGVIGGPPALTSHMTRFVMGQNADGRLQVFMASVGPPPLSEPVYTAYQTTPGGAWSAFASLGSPGGFISGIRVASNANGRLEVFVSALGEVYSNTQLEPSGTQWGGWGSLGAPPGSFVLGDVGQNQDGRLQIFAPVGSQVYTTSQSTPGGAWVAWSSIGGINNTITRGPRVARNTNGRLEVFVSDSPLFGLWRIYSNTQQTPGGAWGGFGVIDILNNISDIEVSQNADGRLQVFVLSPDGMVSTVSQTTPGGAWGLPTGIGGPGGSIRPDVAVGQNQDGRLEVFVGDTSKQYYSNPQNTPGGTWGGWLPIGRIMNPGRAPSGGQPVGEKDDDKPLNEHGRDVLIRDFGAAPSEAADSNVIRLSWGGQRLNDQAITALLSEPIEERWLDWVEQW